MRSAGRTGKFQSFFCGKFYPGSAASGKSGLDGKFSFDGKFSDNAKMT